MIHNYNIKDTHIISNSITRGMRIELSRTIQKHDLKLISQQKIEYLSGMTKQKLYLGCCNVLIKMSKDWVGGKYISIQKT